MIIDNKKKKTTCYSDNQKTVEQEDDIAAKCDLGLIGSAVI